MEHARKVLTSDERIAKLEQDVIDLSEALKEEKLINEVYYKENERLRKEVVKLRRDLGLKLTDANAVTKPKDWEGNSSVEIKDK